MIGLCRSASVRSGSCLTRLRVEELVGDVLAGLQPTLQRAGVAVDIGVAAGVGAVEIDKLRFEQAVIALVTNAVEASRSGQRVRVDVRPSATRGKGWELAVIDRGTGIPAGNRARIFRPFFTTKRDGNGIGLAMVQAVVEAHGGTIGVESETGQGTRFSIFVPRGSD